MANQAGASTLRTVTVSWDRNVGDSTAGYEVCYGTVSGYYTKAVNAANRTEVEISGLQPEVTYYFAVQAYNAAGVRSRRSAEVTYRGAAPIPNHAPQGYILSPSTGGTIVAGDSVFFSATGFDPDGDKSLTYRWDFGAGAGIASSSVRNPGSVTFNFPGTYRITLTVSDSKGLADPTVETRFIKVIRPWDIAVRSGWKLKYVNSEESDGYAAVQAFDNDPKTMWHTRWRSGTQPPPHQIQIDLGSTRVIKGFQYLPRQDGFSVGDIGRYEFYVSGDGVKWGKPVATGTFASSQEEKRVFSISKTGRYIRLVSLSEANGYNDCSVAELNVLDGPPSNRAPVARSRMVTTGKNRKKSFQLKGFDADGNPVTYQILTKPRHGRLAGIPPYLTYKPDKGFVGRDRFTFRLVDGRSRSNVANVAVRVKAPAKKKTKAAAVAAISKSTPAHASKSAASLSLAAAGNSGSVRVFHGATIIHGRKFLTITVRKATLPPGAVPRVEVSSNLVDWFSGRNHTTVMADNETFLKVRDNIPITAGRKRYIRLKRSAD